MKRSEPANLIESMRLLTPDKASECSDLTRLNSSQHLISHRPKATMEERIEAVCTLTKLRMGWNKDSDVLSMQKNCDSPSTRKTLIIRFPQPA